MAQGGARLRIAIVTEYFPVTVAGEIFGGLEARAFYLSRELSKRHDVHVIASWSAGAPRISEIDGVYVHRVGADHPVTSEGAALRRLRFAQAAGRETIRLGAFDVVEAEKVTVFPTAYRAARRLGAAAVALWAEVWLGQWVRHKGLLTGSLGALWERSAMRRPWDAIIAISAFTRDKLLAHGVDPLRLHIVHCGFNHPATTAVAGGEKAAYDLVSVGRMLPSKRIDTLIDAVALLARRAPTWFGKLRCHVIGLGDTVEELRRRAADGGVTARFHFHGPIASHADVLRRIAQSSLLVHASSVEGFGIVLIEANAVGTPFLASDIPPHREVASLTGGNRLFPLGDAHALADALWDHFEGTPITPGDASRLTWDALAREVEDIYHRAIDTASRR